MAGEHRTLSNEADLHVCEGYESPISTPISDIEGGLNKFGLGDPQLKTDEQTVSRMVLLAKLQVSFSRIMSDMSNEECNGQLHSHKKHLEATFKQLYPDELPAFVQEAIKRFPLTTAALLKDLRLQPKLTQYAACTTCSKLHPPRC